MALLTTPFRQARTAGAWWQVHEQWLAAQLGAVGRQADHCGRRQRGQRRVTAGELVVEYGRFAVVLLDHPASDETAHDADAASEPHWGFWNCTRITLDW